MADFDDRPRQGLGEAALTGVRWMAYGRGITEIAHLASTIVLARLIAPSEFGVVAVALIVSGFAGIFSGLGLVSALVQRRTIEPAHLSAAMAMSLVAGVAGAVAVYLAAPLAGLVLGDAIVGPLRLVAPVFVFTALSATSHALLQRRLEFARLTLSGVIASGLSIALGVALAIAGLDAEALIIAAVARAGLQSAILLYLARPPRPRWHRDEARELLGFGAPTAAGSMGYLAFRHIDYAIVGAQLGFAQLGFYWRGYQLAFEHQHKVTDVMQRIAFPIYSRSNDLEHMRALRVRIVRLHGIVLFPALFWLVAAAPEFVPWLYGATWEPAVTPVQILALGGIAVPVLAGSGSMLLAAGFPRQLMIANWLAAIAFAAVVAGAAPQGLTVLCVAVVAYHLVKLALMQRLMMERLAGVTTRAVVEESAPALLSSVALALIAAAVLEVASGAPAFAALAASAAAGLAFYLAAVRRFSPAGWDDARLVARRLAPERVVALLRRALVLPLRRVLRERAA